MAVEPVVALQGPRSVGKPTMLHEIAREHAVSIVDLDRPELRESVAADPAAFVGRSAPVCNDEFQKAPIVLDAIKAELNRDLRPGRFLITGSTRSGVSVSGGSRGSLLRVERRPESRGLLSLEPRRHRRPSRVDCRRPRADVVSDSLTLRSEAGLR